MGQVLPGQEPLAYNGVVAANPPDLVRFANAPLPGYTQFNVGDLGIVPSASGALYYLQSFSGSPASNNFVANWVNISGGAGVFTSLAVSGAITAGTSISAGTTITAGTGFTATTGNFTATTGNFVASASGQGIVLNSPTATGVAASPLVLNGRSGRAVFTTVSIAAAADLTLTITNSAITGATTQVLYSMSGSTTGSAPSIKSVTNSAGSSAIVVTNGTGATTTTSDITLTFLVLN